MQVQVGMLPTWITYSVDISPNPLLKEGYISITQRDTIRLPLDVCSIVNNKNGASNYVHLSTAVHQNTSCDLPDIHVKQPQRQTLTLAILISNLLTMFINRG